MGSHIRVSANDAHFISLGNGRLSTGVSIHDIPVGNITIGSSESCDIIIKGPGVQDVHCTITRRPSSATSDLGDVILAKNGSAKILVEGFEVHDECTLQQGSMLQLGDSSYLRFNFPRKAALLKTTNAMDENSAKEKYDEVLRKSLNTSFVNFAEYNSEKSLNNTDKVTEKMKNLKLKTNDPYSPKVAENQAHPTTSNSTDEMQQLEQVLKMFVDYNNDNPTSASNKSLTSPDKIQNRIKTNGSLPKNFHTKDHGHNSFEFYESKATDDIEVYKKPQSPRTRIKTFVSSPTKQPLSPTDNNDKSYEKDYEKLIKSFEEKFRMDIYNIQNCERPNDSAEQLDSSYLMSEKNEILSKVRELKILISDIQLQESETYLDSDVEKSLVLAEMSNEKNNLQKLNEKLSELKTQMTHLEIQRIKKQKQQEIKQIQLKNSIKDMEAEIKMLEDQKQKSPDSEARLSELLEKLEVDRKTHEDLEFHYLEEEAEWASLHEEYKDNIGTFTRQISEKKSIIQQLEKNKQANDNFTQDEQRTLEKRLFNLKQKLENEREKLKNIDKILSAKTSPVPEKASTSRKALPPDSAFDRNSDIMSKSFNENMFFNRNKIEVSHFDFNLLNGDVESTTDSRNSTIKSSHNQTKPIVTESTDNASPLTMPKYHSLSSIDSPQDGMVPYSHKPNGNGSTSPATAVVPRQIPKHKRPLTRYLPNFSLDFNLRRHIETAGHQLQLCPHVIINATSCRGFLNKVGAKPLFSMRANNRWFVFDRERQMLVYYTDKNEKKPRGGAYFNAITDVYFDHSTAMKNKRTFIVKTKSRTYTLQAPSQQACSIWIDVIITGAQGKILEYDK